MVLTCSTVPHVGNVYVFWTDNGDESRATSSSPQNNVDKSALLEEIVDCFLLAGLGPNPADRRFESLLQCSRDTIIDIHKGFLQNGGNGFSRIFFESLGNFRRQCL